MFEVFFSNWNRDFESQSRRTRLDRRSVELRKSVLRGFKGGNGGHVASAFSLVEILRTLYDSILNFDPRNPHSTERDKVILSKGHGCLALYAILADKGFFPHSNLDTFCRANSILGGHPNSFKIPGVDFSTGSLGHGMSVGVGMALAAKLKMKNSKVFVILGDGELGEGSVWEGALSARKHELDNLTAVVDFNKGQAAGPVAEILPLEPLRSKWESFGFMTFEANGHDIFDIEKCLRIPASHGRPKLVLCHTVKGKGAESLESDRGMHYIHGASDEFVRRLEVQLEENLCFGHS